jgi:hypothetical protein
MESSQVVASWIAALPNLVHYDVHQASRSGEHLTRSLDVWPLYCHLASALRLDGEYRKERAIRVEIRKDLIHV